MDKIKLSHGNGGVENNELISKVFYKAFKNDILEKSEDAAIIHGGELAFSTDSFTVTPLFFAGADIGKLAVCGTCNDLAMMGARPKYLTCSFIIEEGFCIDNLERIVESMRKELKLNGAKIVSGDTKVMPKGTIDKIIINTTGIGLIEKKGISSNSISQNDVILVNRDIGTHGAVIFASREGIELQSDLKSDCSSLYPIVKELIENDVKITALRDATRGGISAVLNEWANQSNISIEVNEEKVPVCDEVNGLCEILGFDAMSLANEGTFVLAIKKDDEQKALDILKKYNKNASTIAQLTSKYPKKVILNSSWGTSRFLDAPSGELLPRIC
ncbi:MAG: hydrogenase expression/formation protein HypE [Campylobacterota bacterium]|nr:hydrogenase expression/formation protein HypE [Campylobacterota bacterium]